MKKFFIAFCCTLLLLPVGFSQAESVLDTKSFIITIDVRCEEGNVSCDDVRYTGISKADGTTLQLKGKTLNKAKSLDMYGYTFKNGAYTYSILTQKEPAALQIWKNGKLIRTETGDWQSH